MSGQTGEVLALAWSGSTGWVGQGRPGEFLPDRPDHSSLPDPDRDRLEVRRQDTIERLEEQTREAAKADPWDVETRFCFCGCGGILPNRRKKDGRIKAGKRGPGYLRGHATRDRMRQARGGR